jgi:hypothetical protein
LSVARFLVRPRATSASFDCVVFVAYLALMARSLSMPDILVVARVAKKCLFVSTRFGAMHEVGVYIALVLEK